MFLSKLSKEKFEIEYDFVLEILIGSIIFGIIGARLYYVIFNFSNYFYNPQKIFAIRDGGLAIYGAIIAIAIFLIIYCKIRKKNFLDLADYLIPYLALGQSIGRWGNFFNQEAHGTEVTLDFLQRLHLPNFIIEGMHINGTYYHPTFLYESLWCLLGFIILLLIRKFTKRKEGIVTYSYFIWYGIGRLFIEGLRTDSLYIGKIRVSQLVSIILILIGLIGIIINLIKRKEVKK